MAEKHVAKQKRLPNGKKVGKMFEFKFELNLKNILLGLFVLFLVVSLIGSIGGQNSYTEKPLSTVITDIKGGTVSKIEVEEGKLTLEYGDGSHAVSRKESQESIYTILKDANVDPGKRKLP